MRNARPTAAGVVMVLGLAACLVAAQGTSTTDASNGRPETRGSASVVDRPMNSQTGSGARASDATGSRGELAPSLVRAFGGTRAVTRPSKDAVMGFSLPTRITEIVVRGGQDVVKDQLMIRGDDVEDQAFLQLQELRAQSETPVKAAKAAMDLAELEFERVGEVFKNGGSNQQEYDRARLTADRARLDYDAAKETQAQERVGLAARRARVEKILLRAPFDGQVDSVQGDIGQSMSEQDKVVRVVNVDHLWIDVPAPMNDAATLNAEVGAPAWILVGTAGVPRLMQGKIIEVAPTTDLSSRSRRVRVEVANPKGENRLIAGDESWTRLTVPSDEAIEMIRAAGGAVVAKGT